MLYTICSLEETVQDLQDIFQNKFTSNAFLLSGAKGLGKAIIVDNLVKSILRTSHHYNQDLLWIDTIQKDISVQDIKNIEEFSSKTAFGRYKIIVVNIIDDLNSFSSNALLKILEELSDNCYVMLISNNISFVAKTIRSRCVNIRFAQPSYAISYLLVQKRFPNENQHNISLCLDFADNSPIVASYLLENRAIMLYQQIMTVMKSLRYNIESLYEFIDNNFSTGNTAKQWKVFKILIIYFLKQFVTYSSNKTIKIDNVQLKITEQELFTQTHMIKNIETKLELFEQINKLLYYADYSNLSLVNTILLIFYKLAFK